MRTGRVGWRRALAPGVALVGLWAGAGLRAQVPPPGVAPARATDLIARREAILRDERAGLAAAGVAPRPEDAPRADGATRFDPLPEVVNAAAIAPDPAVPPAARAARGAAATALYDLAMAASRAPDPPLAFIDECLRGALARQVDHPEARRLLGFVPHGAGGWATPFAAQELARGKVKDPTFGWVPADWVPHLARGELPAPQPSTRWLPADEADAHRRDWKTPWRIETEHFVIFANVPLSGVIAFGGHFETFHQLFHALLADVIGPELLPLARRLKDPKLKPQLSSKKKHEVFYFATRDEYAARLAPLMGADARKSLGIYFPRGKEFRDFGPRSYFFNDVGGQLDVTATLYHEVSHQLLFESAGTTDYAKNPGNYWVFEGLGTYFETVQPQADGSVLVGGLVGPRIAQARRRLLDDGELIPIEAFVNMGRAVFNGRDDADAIYLHYTEAMALAVFLMQNGEGRDREPFLDYARDAYKGHLRGGHVWTLEARLGRPYAEVEREFRAYLGRVALPARPPAPAATGP